MSIATNIRSSLFLRMSMTVGFTIAVTATFAFGIDIVTAPTNQQQRFDSWGVSLAWSGNAIGDWEESKLDSLMDRMFEPANHLGFTFARYNIGGGQNPFLAGQMRPGGAVPGWAPDFVAESDIPDPSTWSWNWDADPRQRNTLNEAIERGVRHTEAFALSPPYWMTITKDSSGGINGGENLQPQYYDEYAHYMTEVVRHFYDDRGIFFETLSPMNEANQSWWVAGGAQEGMHVPRGTRQRALIERVGEALAAKDSLTTISATDGFNANASRANYEALNAYTKSFVSSVGTHTYGTNFNSDLQALQNTVAADNKRLIVSEYGNSDQTALEGGMRLAQRISADLNTMRVGAWTYWQGIEWDNGSGWGLVRQDFLNPSSDHVISQQYHVMRHYAGNIRPGARILTTTDSETVAAFDPNLDRTTIVVHRDGATDTKSYTLADKQVEFSRVIQTSAQQNYRSLGPASLTGSTVNQLAPNDSVTTVLLYHQANLIENARFDYPAGQSGSLTSISGGWSASGNAGFYNDTSNSNGLNSGVAALRLTEPNGSGRLQQDGIGESNADLTGIAYQMSIDLRFYNSDSTGDFVNSNVSLGFEFLSADGQTLTHETATEFMTTVQPDIADSSYRVYQTDQAIAPHGTRFVRPVIRFENTNGSSSDWLYVDNAYLQTVNWSPRGVEWNVDSGGVFGDEPNWQRDTLREHHSHRIFGDAISANRTIAVNSSAEMAGITFNSPHSYTLSGIGEISIDGADAKALIDARQGSQRVAIQTIAESDLNVRVLPGARMTFDRLDLAGRTLHKTGGGELSLGFGSELNDGTLRVDLTESSTITISNLANLNGRLQLDVPSGKEIELGQTFQPVSYINGSREFQELVLPVLDGGLVWDISYESNSLILSVIVGTTGDFNFDGNFDCSDINALVAEIVNATNNGDFDLTGDGVVDAADVQEWLIVGGANNPGTTDGNPFLPGDANLDGFVDAGDFNVWNANKFTNSAAWCNADFNADGAVDAGDFNVWNANKFSASRDLANVPEPSGMTQLLWSLLLARLLQRTRITTRKFRQYTSVN